MSPKKESKPNPLIGSVELSTGTVSTPYQVDDGHCTLIGGTADLAAVSQLLAGEQVHPVQTREGRALMGIWVCAFEQAHLGPHLELQLSFVVSKKPLKPLKPRPFAMLHLLAVNPSAGMLADRIWNDSQAVLAYNNEHLGLRAEMGSGEFGRDAEQQTKQFSFFQGGSPILSGQVNEAKKQSRAATFQMMRLFGLRDSLKFNAKPWMKVKIINPVGEVLPDNRAASTYTLAESVVLQHFDPETDTIGIQHPRYQGLDFQPQLIEHLNQIKFIYLDPVEW